MTEEVEEEIMKNLETEATAEKDLVQEIVGLDQNLEEVVTGEVIAE